MPADVLLESSKAFTQALIQDARISRGPVVALVVNGELNELALQTPEQLDDLDVHLDRRELCFAVFLDVEIRVELEPQWIGVFSWGCSESPRVGPT